MEPLLKRCLELPCIHIHENGNIEISFKIKQLYSKQYFELMPLVCLDNFNERIEHLARSAIESKKDLIDQISMEFLGSPFYLKRD